MMTLSAMVAQPTGQNWVRADRFGGRCKAFLCPRSPLPASTAATRAIHLVAQWRWRREWGCRLRPCHDSRLLRGLSRDLRQPLGRQVLGLRVNRFGQCAIKGYALIVRKYGPTVGRRHFPAEKHAACVAC